MQTRGIELTVPVGSNWLIDRAVPDACALCVVEPGIRRGARVSIDFWLAYSSGGRALAPVVDLCSLDALAIRSLNKEHTQAPTRIPDKLQVLASTRLPWSDVVLSRKIAPAASACVPHSASTSPHDARKRRLTGRVQLSRVAQRLLGIRVRSYPCSRLVGGRSSWRARLAPSEHQLFQSSSASRVTAGAAGFFTFQQSVRPERYGDPSRFDRRAGNRSPGALTCGRASPPRRSIP